MKELSLQCPCLGVGQYRRYAKSKARYANEQFMELFDEDLVTLPEHLPAWFIDQRRMMVYLLFLGMLCAIYGFGPLKSTKWVLLYEFQEEEVDNFQGFVVVGRGGSSIHGTIATGAILSGIRRGDARWPVHH